ncbi:exocyst complex component EXO84B-like [Papaver somniferum]|uniref:exocyst complex component EXO84B-like n=1 Tax=Papaver somniferum TaxID=3469 RepID=UPI000E6FF0CE|nr:exocyst complex component EXO84B-like [Papaver somniferum]
MDTSRGFRFRDPENSDDSTSDEYSDSSIDESRLESMTGKGIKRLCSELVELKRASDGDFQRNICSNYSSFVRIFNEVGTMENEFIHLKQHVLTQRKLVKNLTDGIYRDLVSEESIETIIEESLYEEHYQPSNLEITETMDILLSEHRLDEALGILEIWIRPLKIIQSEENPPMQVLISYSSAILERKSRLVNQLALVASHPRVAAPELRKALAGLQRLGESQLATHIMLKYYHHRLLNGISSMQSSKEYLHGIYFKELAKFVFSVISQGAKSFETLHGDKSPYASEFIQWTREALEVFVIYFDKHVKSDSEINGRLSAAVAAVGISFSFCSLLEAQSITLQPCLVKLMRPCMNEVLKMHIDHFKKVVGIFTATDDWVLGKYLISGILNERALPMITGRELEYCMLTNSGRKLTSMLQGIISGVLPLIDLQMEISVLNGLMELFREYIETLVKVIPCKMNILDAGGSRVILAQALSQQVSVLANASALVDIFSITFRSIFMDNQNFGFQSENMGSRGKELDTWIVAIQQISNQLTTHFCQQFVHRFMCPDAGSRICAETYTDSQEDSELDQDFMPSSAFQVLFLEMRGLKNLVRQIFVTEVWRVEELLKELMETVFVWLSNCQDFWKAIEDKSTINVQQSRGFEQFIVDMHFLLEISRFGGFFSENMLDASMDLIYRIEPAFTYVECDPNRDVLADEWATDVANAAIKKILEYEILKSPSVAEPTVSTFLEDTESGKSIDSVREDDFSSVEDFTKLEDGITENLPKRLATYEEIQISEVTISDEAMSKIHMTDKTQLEPSRIFVEDKEKCGFENLSDSYEDARSSIEDVTEVENEVVGVNETAIINQELWQFDGITPSLEVIIDLELAKTVKLDEAPLRTFEEDFDKKQSLKSNDVEQRKENGSSSEKSEEFGSGGLAVEVLKAVILDHQMHNSAAVISKEPQGNNKYEYSEDEDEDQSFTGCLGRSKEEFGTTNAAIANPEEIETRQLPNACVVDEVSEEIGQKAELIDEEASSNSNPCNDSCTSFDGHAA